VIRYSLLVIRASTLLPLASCPLPLASSLFAIRYWLFVLCMPFPSRPMPLASRLFFTRYSVFAIRGLYTLCLFVIRTFVPCLSPLFSPFTVPVHAHAPRSRSFPLAPGPLPLRYSLLVIRNSNFCLSPLAPCLTSTPFSFVLCPLRLAPSLFVIRYSLFVISDLCLTSTHHAHAHASRPRSLLSCFRGFFAISPFCWVCGCALRTVKPSGNGSAAPRPTFYFLTD